MRGRSRAKARRQHPGFGARVARAAGLLGSVALPALLACCAPPRADMVAVAQDRSGTPLPPPSPGAPRPDFGGYYVGSWTPAPDGACAHLSPVARDMLVGPAGAVSGVNYPLRGAVEPDGQAFLTYGGAKVAGRFGPDGFAGRADSGNGCAWQVSMARQPPIGRAPGSEPLPDAAIVQGQVPDAPGQEPQPGPRLGRR